MDQPVLYFNSSHLIDMITLEKMLEGTTVVPRSANKNHKVGLLPKLIKWQPMLLFIALLVLWIFSPVWLSHMGATAAGIDQSIWLLIILSLTTFLMISALCWWLLQLFWLIAGLTPLKIMVSQFHTLSLWQQLSFYLASFSLLLVVASLCLSAIC